WRGKDAQNSNLGSCRSSTLTAGTAGCVLAPSHRQGASREVSMGKVVRFALALFIASLLGAAASVPVAADYGNSGGNVQLYQLTASMNCNNPDVCGDMLGGHWAWGGLTEDGSFQ